MAHHTPEHTTITIHAHHLKAMGIALFGAAFVAIGI
jgi:hypothetical protein